MHEYKCVGECKGTSFYTDFAPRFDPPAYCPTCGTCDEVTYVGEKKIDTTKFNEISNLLARLYDIRKGSMKYGLSDLCEWLENDLDKVGVMLDELCYEVTGGGE